MNGTTEEDFQIICKIIFSEHFLKLNKILLVRSTYELGQYTGQIILLLYVIMKGMRPLICHLENNESREIDTPSYMVRILSSKQILSVPSSKWP